MDESLNENKAAGAPSGLNDGLDTPEQHFEKWWAEYRKTNFDIGDKKHAALHGYCAAQARMGTKLLRAQMRTVHRQDKAGDLSEELVAANEHIRKLKSDLEDSNAMNLPGTQQCIYTDVSNALKQANATIAALQAKIADAQLLAVIEQMREALLATGIKWPVVLEALALTPDLSALKEHDARVLEKAADWFNADEQDAWEVAAELNRMASELRKT